MRLQVSLGLSTGSRARISTLLSQLSSFGVALRAAIPRAWPILHQVPWWEAPPYAWACRATRSWSIYPFPWAKACAVLACLHHYMGRVMVHRVTGDSKSEGRSSQVKLQQTTCIPSLCFICPGRSLSTTNSSVTNRTISNTKHPSTTVQFSTPSTPLGNLDSTSPVLLHFTFYLVIVPWDIH